MSEETCGFTCREYECPCQRICEELKRFISVRTGSIVVWVCSELMDW